LLLLLPPLEHLALWAGEGNGGFVARDALVANGVSVAAGDVHGSSEAKK